MPETTTTPDSLMSLSEVAAYLGLSPGSIYNLRHGGHGPEGYKVGRQLRFRRSEIEAWLEQRRDEPRVQVGA